MATRTWNGSVWDTLPVGGDTIFIGSATPPTGANLPAAGVYAVTVPDNGVVDAQAEDYIGAGSLGVLRVEDGDSPCGMLVGSDFASASVIYSDALLTINGDCETGVLTLEGGGSVLVTGAAFAVASLVLVAGTDSTITVESGALELAAFARGPGATVELALTAGAGVVLGFALASGLTWAADATARIRLEFDGSILAESLPGSVIVIAGSVGFAAQSYTVAALELDGGTLTVAGGTVLTISGGGMIAGAGTLAAGGTSAIVPRVTEGIRNGGNMPNVKFQYGRNGTAAHTGTAT